MTPQEKAKELVEKFKTFSYYDAHDLTPRYRREESNVESACECALIAVDEVLRALDGNMSLYNHSDSGYWKKVKQEIENFK